MQFQQGSERSVELGQIPLKYLSFAVLQLCLTSMNLIFLDGSSKLTIFQSNRKVFNVCSIRILAITP